MGQTVISENGKYEWDEEKNLINIQKHGFGFAEILDVFDDPFFLERFDEEHSSLDEERYIGFGLSGGQVVIMTSYTERGRTRLISARFASKQEEEIYYDARKNC